MPKVSVQSQPNTSWYFQYRRHDSTHWRIWRTDWANDQFEILSDYELTQLKIYACLFVKFTELEDD